VPGLWIALAVLSGAIVVAIARARRELDVPVVEGSIDIIAQAPESAALADAAPAATAPAAGAGLLTHFGATLKKLFAIPEAGLPYADLIARAERQHGIPESLLARVLYQESRFREDIITGRTRSPAGALGIAQFMPATARELGIDPLNPQQAIPAAALYLRRLYNATGDWAKALASYNWGIGNVTRRGIEVAPAETQAYMREILADVDVA